MRGSLSHIFCSCACAKFSVVSCLCSALPRPLARSSWYRYICTVVLQLMRSVHAKRWSERP